MLASQASGGGDLNAVVSFFDLLHNRIGIEAASPFADSGSQTSQVLKGMERGLVGIAQGGRLGLADERHTLLPMHLHAHLARRFEFAVENALISTRGVEQVPVQPPEIAADA